MTWAGGSVPGAGNEALNQVEALAALTQKLAQQTAELEALAAHHRALLAAQAGPQSGG